MDIKNMQFCGHISRVFYVDESFREIMAAQSEISLHIPW